MAMNEKKEKKKREEINENEKKLGKKSIEDEFYESGRKNIKKNEGHERTKEVYT